MPDLHNVRDVIETLLAALSGEATLAEGTTLRIEPLLRMTLSRTDADATTAVLSFEPSPAIHVRRGPFLVRCRLKSVSVGPDEVHASIEGWFDRRWKVVS